MFKFISKTQVCLLSDKNNSINNIVRSLNDIRRLNIFTSRGIKISKQLFFKKKGKVSSYN